MTRSVAEQLVWEISSYGMTTLELEAFRSEERKLLTSDKMIALNLLRDAQHLVDEACRQTNATTLYAEVCQEKARQHINCAKWIILNHLQSKELLDKGTP